MPREGYIDLTRGRYICIGRYVGRTDTGLCPDKHWPLSRQTLAPVMTDTGLCHAKHWLLIFTSPHYKPSVSPFSLVIENKLSVPFLVLNEFMCNFVSS